MIEVRSVSKSYGRVHAVSDLSFTVRPGVVTGFLGPNGSGKSTTMRMIVGLDAPDRGEVLVSGLATGLPAASASPLAIFQAQAAWREVLLLSQTGAAAIVLAFHAANFVRLSALHRHLDPAAAGLVVGIPYAIGGLLLLRADGLLLQVAAQLEEAQPWFHRYAELDPVLDGTPVTPVRIT